jgi:hypothetical protein
MINIFKSAVASNPLLPLNEEEDLSENSQGSDRGHQELKDPAEHIMKYDYEKQFEKLG